MLEMVIAHEAALRLCAFLECSLRWLAGRRFRRDDCAASSARSAGRTTSDCWRSRRAPAAGSSGRGGGVAMAGKRAVGGCCMRSRCRLGPRCWRPSCCWTLPSISACPVPRRTCAVAPASPASRRHRLRRDHRHPASTRSRSHCPWRSSAAWWPRSARPQCGAGVRGVAERDRDVQPRQRAPAGIARPLAALVRRHPDMHRVHHSIIVRETNSNFGFNLPYWDHLFGTYRASPPMARGDDIGLEAFRDLKEVPTRSTADPTVPGRPGPAGLAQPAGARRPGSAESVRLGRT